MKERPILFNAEMVRALLDGRKAQTRRIVKPTKDRNGSGCHLSPCEVAGEINAGDYFLCPYGQPGDRLWVRESFWGCDLPGYGDQPCVVYDNEWQGKKYKPEQPRPWARKFGRIPSIHMPRDCSRILLEIVSVRVERLQDISDNDIAAEGVNADCVRNLLMPMAAKHQEEPCYWFGSAYTDAGLNYCRACAEKHHAKLVLENPGADPADIRIDGGWDTSHDTPPACTECGSMLSGHLTDAGIAGEIDHFMSHWGAQVSPQVACELIDIVYDAPPALLWKTVWSMINGVESWDANPWVWVVEFKRLEDTDERYQRIAS